MPIPPLSLGRALAVAWQAWWQTGGIELSVEQRANKRERY